MSAASYGHVEPITGKYVHVDIDGTDHRIYFEALKYDPPTERT